MVRDYKEPGTLLFNQDIDYQDMNVTEMIIIFEGMVATYVTLEDKSNLVLDYLSRGAIIRPNHFLNARKHSFNVGVKDLLIYYCISAEKL